MSNDSDRPKNGENELKLRARAQQLAKEPLRAAHDGPSVDVIVFALGTEVYALETAYVREVYPLKDFTALPGVPPFILGIVNVRGQILSVVDLKKFFGLANKGLGELNKVIILHNEHMEFGILADVILGNRPVFSMELQDSLPALTGIRAEYLKGVTSEALIVLDGQRILNDRRMLIHDEATALPVVHESAKSN